MSVSIPMPAKRDNSAIPLEMAHLPDFEKERVIGSSKSFDDLFRNIERIGFVTHVEQTGPGVVSRRPYSYRELIAIIAVAGNKFGAWCGYYNRSEDKITEYSESPMKIPDPLLRDKWFVKHFDEHQAKMFGSLYPFINIPWECGIREKVSELLHPFVEMGLEKLLRDAGERALAKTDGSAI